MKKILICLLIATICNFKINYAQSIDSCGTSDMDSALFVNQPWFGNNQYLNDFLDSMGYPKPNTTARIIDKDRVWFHLPIKIWNIRRSNGTGGISDQTIRNQVRHLNEVYNQINDSKIGFYTTCDITNLNSDNYYRVGGNGFGAFFVAASLTNNYYQAGAINIYFTGSVAGANGVTYAGNVPFGPSKCIIIASNPANNPNVNTLPHEMGHYLGLEHTHRSANYPNIGNRKCFKECIDRDREYTFFSLCFGNRLKSSRICESTGDALSDTPADPDLSNNTGSDCANFNSAGNFSGWQDPWNDYYTDARFPHPQVTNPMSYGNTFTVQCRTQFTRMQIAVMMYNCLHSNWGSESMNDKYIYDEYEPDNTWQFAQSLSSIINVGEVQARNFHQAINGLNLLSTSPFIVTPIVASCDVDWVSFTPSCTRSLTIETYELPNKPQANTRLTLFDGDGTTQLAQNDDISGTNKFSSLTYNFVAGHTYAIRIENMSPGTTTYYKLAAGSRAGDADIVGVNQFCTTANYSPYNFSSLLSGTIANWSITPNNLVTTTPLNNPNITLTKGTDGIINLRLRLNNVCNPNTIEFNKEIIVGYGLPPTNFSLDDIKFEPSPNPRYPSLRFNATVFRVPAATMYKLYINNVYKGGYLSSIGTTGEKPVITGIKLDNCGVKYNLRIDALTPCGIISTGDPRFQQKCNGQYQQRFASSAHPTIANTVTLAVRQYTEDELSKLFFDATALSVEQIQTVAVYDKEGSKVLLVENIGTQVTNLDLSALPEGIYTIEIYGNNDYREQQTYEYAVTKTPQQIEEELAANNLSITDPDAIKLNEVLQQELYQKIRENTDLLNNSTVLQNFMLTQEQGTFGTIEKINDALYNYDVTTAQMLINNWLPTTNLELNCLQYYNYFIKYLNGGTFTATELSDMYGLANLCPQKDGEIIYAARSLYNYITQLDETFSTACGSNAARNIQKINMATAKVGVNAISIYPNPAKDNFSIKFPATTKGINTIKVIDMFGKTLIQKNTISGTQNINITQQLAKGIYTVQITNSATGKTETQKLIIQ